MLIGARNPVPCQILFYFNSRLQANTVEQVAGKVYTWRWQSDDGWMDYSPPVAQSIEQQYLANVPKGHFDVAGRSYVVDFNVHPMVQVGSYDPQKRERSVERVAV